MSTQTIEHPPGTEMFSLEDVAYALMRQRGITEGLWRIGCTMRFGGVTLGWESGGNVDHLPTGMIGLTGIGLTPVNAPGELVFDAAQVLDGPARPAKKRASRARKAIGA